MITVERCGTWASSQLEKKLESIIKEVRKQVSALSRMPSKLKIQGGDFIKWHKECGNEYIQIREIDEETGYITEFQPRHIKSESQVQGILLSLRADGWMN